MKQLLLIITILLSGISSAQEIKGADKFAKNIIKAVKSDKGFKKIIIPHDEMKQLVDIMFEEYYSAVKEEGAEELLEPIKKALKDIKSDSAYNSLTGKMKGGFWEIREELIAKGIEPSSVKFIEMEYEQGEQEVEALTEAKFKIKFSGNKGQDTLSLVAKRCVFMDGKWYVGNKLKLQSNLSMFGIDMDRICDCVRDQSLEGCEELGEEIEEKMEALSEEERNQFIEVVLQCLDDEELDKTEEATEEAAEEGWEEAEAEEVTEEAAEEAVEESAMEVEENHDFSTEEIEEARSNIASQIDDYCDCGLYLKSETLPTGCEEKINEILDLLNRLETRDREIYEYAIETCKD